MTLACVGAWEGLGRGPSYSVSGHAVHSCSGGCWRSFTPSLNQATQSTRLSQPALSPPPPWLHMCTIRPQLSGDGRVRRCAGGGGRAGRAGPLPEAAKLASCSFALAVIILSSSMSKTRQ